MTSNQLTVNALLDTFIAEHSPIIEEALDQYSDFSLNDSRSELQNAIRHSLLNGGKRIRPLLVLATQRLFSYNKDAILPLAIAIEMIHTYSLIHDDLPSMDNDDLRRGKPTCHKAFGEDMAILAGDNLNTLAFEILSTQLTHYDATDLLRVIQIVSSLTGMHGLIGGQVLDIKYSSGNESVDDLMSIHQKKTGALFKCCILCPAILEQADDNSLQHLEQFATHLGLLFQIVDDVLDVTGDAASLGKTPNKDEQLNKHTYVSLFGLDKAKQMAKVEADKAIQALKGLANDKSDVLEAIVHLVLNRTH